MSFVEDKKWFVLFMVIFLLAVLALLLTAVQPSYSTEKAAYAKQLLEENNAELDLRISDMDTLLAQAPTSTLDDDYYHSIKDDMLWLKAKQTAVFNSKPESKVAVKQMAFTMFFESILAINDGFTMDIGTPNYQERINYALTMDINYPLLLTDEEATATFDAFGEKEIFQREVRSLFEEYITNKKAIINATDSLERKYVEAKKISWISYDK